jgi:hypothetical protein
LSLPTTQDIVAESTMKPDMHLVEACQLSLLAKKDEMEKLHFDIRQYNCIDWQTPEELAGRLQPRIEAMFGDGPYKLGTSTAI